MDDLFPAPFPDREHHSDPCPGCGHLLGIHAVEFGCVYDWTYDIDGHVVTDGCECLLTLASDCRPPRDREI